MGGFGLFNRQWNRRGAGHISVLLLLVFIIWFILLRKKVKRKTEELSREVIHRKKTQEKLIQTVEEGQRALDAIKDLVSIQDMDLNIIKANRALAEVLKLKSGDIIGKKCYELFHKTDAPWPDCPCQKTKKDRKT